MLDLTCAFLETGQQLRGPLEALSLPHSAGLLRRSRLARVRRRDPQVLGGLGEKGDYGSGGSLYEGVPGAGGDASQGCITSSTSCASTTSFFSRSTVFLHGASELGDTGGAARQPGEEGESRCCRKERS